MGGTQDRHAPLVARLARARADPALAVLEGFHALKHALRFGATIEGAWSSDRAELLALAAKLAPDVRPWLEEHVTDIAPEVFQRLAPRGATAEGVALARRPETSWAAIEAAAGAASIVLLDRPRHLGNLGATIRVAAAAGAAAVVTTGTADPWHPAALRGSSGLHFALPVLRLDGLPATARPVVALDPDGERIDPAALPEGALYAFGSERHGLGDDVRARATLRLAIPMRQGVSSLNLATAVAVVLYALRLRRGLTHA